MNYEYNRALFREYLLYPEFKDLELYEDKKRRELLELLIMDWFENLGADFLIKEFEEITKNFWQGAKQQAIENFKKYFKG